MSFLTRRRDFIFSYYPGLIFKNNPEISKKNIGKYLEEGIMLNGPIKRGAHHDGENDLLIKSQGRKSIWLFGDSWGGGLKINENQNQTLAKTVNYNFSNLRIISSGSWSPLLINIARKNRSEIYNEIPDNIILFLDQTDIGNDYCQYRPYVERGFNNELLKVHRNEYVSQEKNLIWGMRILFDDEKSGIIFAIKKLISILYFNTGHGVPGLTSCYYDDLMAWQLGNIEATNGSLTSEYENYFKSNIYEFINELKTLKPDIKFLLVTHDWAQHNLPINDSRRFKKNISTITSQIAAKTRNVESLHIDNRFYTNYGINEKDIYQYPKDLYSHLKNYEVLAKEIGRYLTKNNLID
ncbi:hypothetical protein HA147_06925 [Prochlorococcus marinus XMU1410]|uniref:hypothetical protein n=1 Tax=Prochlorococcus marinus TaxID=1219 RepID=UPI001ADBC5BF|nr:hypothetical protein [Prochlorococcus marinus]MBO8242382.1 hypothetical protein [Prochlorococcus marinus XMU1410]